MKFVSNLNSAVTMLAIAASAVIASPVLAQSSPTVSVRAGTAISAVSDSSEIAMPSIPGGSIGFEANPAFFAGGQLCVTGLGENWAIKQDGTLHQERPIVRADGSVEQRRSARTPSCAPINADGHASVSNPFGPDAVPFVIAADGRIYWAGRNRLTGLNGS